MTLLFAAVVLMAPTTYTLPQNVHWISDAGHGVPPGAYHAVLRGEENAKCGQLIRRKFAAGFTYPWHVNAVSTESTPSAKETRYRLR